jgi:hypothetical protein
MKSFRYKDAGLIVTNLVMQLVQVNSPAIAGTAGPRERTRDSGR